MGGPTTHMSGVVDIPLAPCPTSSSFWSCGVRPHTVFENKRGWANQASGHEKQRTNCLTKESPVVQNSEGLKKGRKSLLTELSSLVKTAKRLQEIQKHPQVHVDDVTL